MENSLLGIFAQEIEQEKRVQSSNFFDNSRRVKQQLQTTACQNESERGYSSPEQINISLTVDSVFMIY